MAKTNKIKRALISVFDKTGIVELGQALHQLGIEIISTGGTLKLLKENEIPAVSVSSFTGFPEVMGGRVKTLHPKIYTGILHRRDNPEDVEQLVRAESRSIDLIIVNLYPFKETVARPDVTDAEAVENIDIGGPTMIRAAAKNHDSVTVVVDPEDYAELLEQIRGNVGATDASFKRKCAKKAFALTADYDAAIANYFAQDEKGGVQFPRDLVMRFDYNSALRYCEIPHQQAAT